MFKKLELEDLYLKQGKSKRNIATLKGCSVETVHRWMNKLEIPSRSLSDAQELFRYKGDIKLDDYELSVFDGLMLSDLSLSCKFKNASANFCFKYEEMAESVIDNLSILDWSNLYKYYEKTRDVISYKSTSKVWPYLTNQYHRWYKNIKIVPKDIKLTPECCYWWYIGDGYISYYSIGLCTDAFSKSDVQFLRDKLFDLNIDTGYLKTRNRISIKSKSVKPFLDYIGVCNHKCYKYKWEMKFKKKRI